jgi:hypothetical protein
LSSDAIESETESDSVVSQIQNIEDPEQDCDDISTIQNQNADVLAPTEHIPTTAQSKGLNRDDLRIRTDALDFDGENEMSDHAEVTKVNDEVASNESECLPVSIEHAHAEVTNVNDEVASNESECLPVSIEHVSHVGNVITESAAPEPIEEMQTASINNKVISKEVKDIPMSTEVLRDRDWVILAAANLKQRGKQKEWEEILDMWVALQRNWDSIEVRYPN